MTAMRILCIEDEAPLREDIAEYLRMKAYEVDEAGTGIEAMLKMRRQHYDLILCDIKMPQMDGHELLRTMRDDDKLMDTPFVFLSALNERADKIRAHENGCDTYLTKPIDFSVLDVTVRSQIERQQLRNVISDSKSHISQQHMMTAINSALSGPLAEASVVIQYLRETVPVLTPNALDEYLANMQMKLNAHIVDLHTFSHALQLQASGHERSNDVTLAEDLVLSAMEEATRHFPSMPVKYKPTKSNGVVIHGDRRMLQRALAGLLAEVAEAHGTKDIIRYSSDRSQASITVADDPHMLEEEDYVLIDSATNLAHLSAVTRQRLATLTYAVHVAQAHEGQLEIMIWAEDKLAVRFNLPKTEIVQ